MEIFCFFAGIVFVYTKSFFSLLPIALVLILRPAKPVCLFWFGGAMIWALVHQWWAIDRATPRGSLITHASLEGIIASIPTINATKSQFHFKVDSLNQQAIKMTLLLTCYRHCPSFKAGQRWHFEAKLKKAANLGNPSSFNYVGWLQARHIVWTGYIKRNAYLLTSKDHTKNNLLSFRESLAEGLREVIPPGRTLGVLQALTLGITTYLPKEQWDLFRRTGTTHLMVISGAHIGLVAGICFSLMQWLWCRSASLCLRYPAKQAASIVGFLMASLYALLAGFAVPAQRALLACFFLFSRNFLSYRFTVLQAWRYALLAVLLFEPHAVLLPGFYLSFLAVAILIATGERLAGRGLKKNIHLQIACLFGLMPLSLYWFSYGAVNGLLANLLAIPFVGFLIVPLALTTLIVKQWVSNGAIIYPVHWAIEYLLRYLSWVDSFSLLNFTFSFTQLWSPLALMLSLMLGFLVPLRTFFLGVITLGITSFFPAYEKVRMGEVQVDVMDVGQGLAVVIRTANHLIIYDTGMRFYQGTDMGKLAIIPYLIKLGVKEIDKVIISHPDLDHRGGLPSLTKAYPIAELIVDNTAFYRRGVSCHHYPQWQWDGVAFRFLAINKQFKDKNNNSCVLQIKTEAGRVLLTGDIEKLAEDYLVARYGLELQSTILVVPHHGSKTSSSPNFIQRVAPQYAILSLGFDNRYHFPHQKTLNTLKEHQTLVYNTVDCGMVTLKLTAKSSSPPSCYKWTKVKG